MTFAPALDAIAFIPAVQAGVLGGPNITACSGWIATDPAPFTAAAIPIGETQSVMVADGLNTYRPARWGLLAATAMLAELTVGAESAFGLGYVLLLIYKTREH